MVELTEEEKQRFFRKSGNLVRSYGHLAEKPSSQGLTRRHHPISQLQLSVAWQQKKRFQILRKVWTTPSFLAMCLGRFGHFGFSFQKQAAQTFATFSPMAPAASRFVATGVALGLASTFVAPGYPRQSAPLRGSNVNTSSATPTGPTGNNHLASLAVASVSLAAVGAGRVKVKATAAEDVPPPLFQPSEQFGATEPLGFFDPLGFTAVGDEKGFRKLRVSEIKHGRVT